MSTQAPRHHQWEVAGVVLPLEDVLLDLTAAHRALWGWWAKTIGIDPAQLATFARGRHVEDVIRAVAPTLDPQVEHERLRERESLLLKTMKRRRGSRPLFRTVPSNRRVIRSTGAGALLEQRQRRARLEQTVTITADDVAVGPPAPDAHLAAVGALGGSAADHLAIEATDAGVRAAKAAGLTTVYVRSRVDDAVPEGTDAVIYALSALRIELIRDGVRLTFSTRTERGH